MDNELQMNVYEEDYLEYERLKRNEKMKEIAKKILDNTPVEQKDKRELIRGLELMNSLQDIDVDQLMKLLSI
jgi:hypothetical protein